MLTYEDLTTFFLNAAAKLELVTHPEHWMNARSLEREFACTCHTGSCEGSENRSSCTISFTWSTMDTALSQEGPVGICDFFHEPDEHCPHLHTSDIPPLVLDLAYSTPLHSTSVVSPSLADLTQMLKLRASENSSRANETRPGVTLAMQDNRLLPEALTLQQRVELPIWHPDGLRGLHDDGRHREEHIIMRRHDDDDDPDDPGEIMADNPRPEEWLPQVLLEVCQDITQVLEALDTISSQER
ncbi:MAG TPA: hypothetical protein VFA09_06155 [Ktedonobacteraceae bacterium]|nr:hypothetical protein [Ktedonobacteraceae bacterium]